MPQPRRHERRENAAITAYFDDIDAARSALDSGEYDPSLTAAFGRPTRLAVDEDGNCRIEHG